ncbi:MAG: thiolase [Dehalococcoidia bacterium]|uniref:thiolase C-terminal domain-containing protein n=1 Tax=Candidatus Amarobacter glycogenicus TaxID=3140699 RepID=UPI002A0D61ED|nr:thiolase [Dehalococcoidia bacterium]MBK6560245.1 thiolase [Dehalococcoidia bacterium]MBK7328505.1 thiolase [Dehalococcoidia bacterium]MBK8559419.1 thiolase [Dehalococcoidia bacterium]MBK9610757.1 thiolase [Dehalococcoidia bacterium]
MPGELSRAAAIVGAAEADWIGYPEQPKTALQLHISAIKNVSKQTGIPISAIDGIFSAGFSSAIAEHLGLHPAYIDTTSVGGCSFEMHVHHALAAIHAGIINVALVTHGENGWSSRATRGAGTGRARGMDPWDPGSQFSNPYGVSGAPSNYSHAMTRHNHRYGTTPEDFGHIAVVTRQWATLNPRAVMFSKETNPAGGPITIDDVNNARLVSWPLTLLHCCLVTDHGGAVLVVSPEIARSVKTKPVWIAGAGESMSHSNMLEMGDFTATSAAASSAAAYRMAGMGPEDMEMAMLYDSFTVTAGITAEMLGLAPRGEGFRLWKDGHAAPGGKFPMNTNGGGLSFNHSGMYGMQLLVEAYRQLSGTAEDGGFSGLPGKQTKARSCIVNGTGGSLSTTGTLVLVAD